MTDRILPAKYAGQKYLIPEAWIMGYCRNGATALEALAYWHSQAEMEKAWQSQQGAK